MRATQDHHPDIRRAAIAALGRLKAPGTYELLCQVLNDPLESKLHGAAITSLGDLGDPRAADLLINRPLDREVIIALAKLQDPRILEPLL